MNQGNLPMSYFYSREHLSISKSIVKDLEFQANYFKRGLQLQAACRQLRNSATAEAQQVVHTNMNKQFKELQSSLHKMLSAATISSLNGVTEIDSLSKLEDLWNFFSSGLGPEMCIDNAVEPFRALFVDVLHEKGRFYTCADFNCQLSSLELFLRVGSTQG